MGISIRSELHESRRRRSSYTTSSSWIRDADDEADADEMSTRTGRSRPCSWGPIGEFFYRDSLSFCDSERSPMSHHECNFKKKKWHNTSAPAKTQFASNSQLYKETGTQQSRIENKHLVKLDFSSIALTALSRVNSSVNSFNQISHQRRFGQTAAICTV